MPTLIAIGNSQGIRIPKPIIKQAHLENRELELVVVEDGLLVKALEERARSDWERNIEKVVSKNKNKKDEAFLGDFLNDSDLETHVW